MKNKFISVMLSAFLLSTMPFQMFANAEEYNTENTSSADSAVSVYAEGLISRYSLSCAGGKKPCT